ncbi:putative per-hexamer repeat protein 5 [Penaeus vannamei]|uniref:putative per-hexamer repeat protein 5 n=1 Tax=Penaeus vannamei TaxID=6689 RepID=UPI00387F7F4B
MRSLILISAIALAASMPNDYEWSGPREGSSTRGAAGASRATVTQGTSSGIASVQGTISGSAVHQGTSSGTSFGRGTASRAAVSRGLSSGTTFGLGTTSQGPCRGGQVRYVDGRCVTPRVNRRVFLYDVPSNVQTSGPVNIPDPHVETNIVLIRTPEGGLGQQPVVIPPPRQNHVVYILNKQNREGPGVIEVPSSGPSTPEVYFVNYAEGENPTLPGGVDLQSALQAASQGAAQAVGLVGQSSSTVGQNGGSTGYSGVQNFGSRIPSGSFSGQVTGLSGQSASFRDQAIGSESAGQTTPDFDLRGSTQNVGSAGLAVSTSGRAGTADSTGQPILSNGQVSGPAISSGSSSSQVIELTGQFASLDDQAIGSAGRSAFSGAKIPGAVSPASSNRGSSVASQPSGLYT